LATYTPLNQGGRGNIRGGGGGGGGRRRRRKGQMALLQ